MRQVIRVLGKNFAFRVEGDGAGARAHYLLWPNIKLGAVPTSEEVGLQLFTSY